MKFNKFPRVFLLAAQSVALILVFGNSFAGGVPNIEILVGKEQPVCQAYIQAARVWNYQGLRCLGDQPIAGSQISRYSGQVTKTEFSFQEDDPTLALRKNIWTFVRGHDVNEANYFPIDKLAEWTGAQSQISLVDQGLQNLGSKYFVDNAIRKISIDLDNDGIEDNVVVHPHCVLGGSEVNTRTFSSPLFLISGTDHVDEKRTDAYLRLPIRRRNVDSIRQTKNGARVAVADFYANSAFGFVTYRGQTYFDFWWDAPSGAAPDATDENVLRLYLPKNGQSRIVCALRFAP